MVTLLQTPCREWQGGRNARGYGTLNRDGKDWYVHRWVWTLANGPIPDGLCVLHHCDNPPCFRIDHLWLGTRADNAKDMVAKGRHAHQLVTHCPQGHPYDEVNTRLYDGRRYCRACKSAAS